MLSFLHASLCMSYYYNNNNDNTNVLLGRRKPVTGLQHVVDALIESESVNPDQSDSRIQQQCSIYGFV